MTLLKQVEITKNDYNNLFREYNNVKDINFSEKELFIELENYKMVSIEKLEVINVLLEWGNKFINNEKVFMYFKIEKDE